MADSYKASTEGYKGVANISDDSVKCNNCGSTYIKRELEPGHIRRSCHGRDVKRVCGDCGAECGEYVDDTMEIRQRDPIWVTKDEIDYGPRWEGIRKRVYARDGWKCQVCGGEKSVEDLHAHHITPLRYFADDDGRVEYDVAHDMDNLVTVCASCHGEVEGEYTHCDYEQFKEIFNSK